jgi:hypothetical protein
MKSVDFLYIALAVFFFIQGGYALILIRNFSGLSKQLKGLGKEK